MPPSETLTLPGVDTLPVERERQRALSQWWTPPDLARRFAAWALKGLRFPTVLEPSAGSGALVRAILDVRPMAKVNAIELDPTWAARLRADGQCASVTEGDFLSLDPLEHDSAHVVIANPPYENGLDGAFLEHAMRMAPRVAALLRVNALVGQERHERVWSRVGRGWHLRSIAYLSRRPAFLAAGEATDGAKSDFVAVQLVEGVGRRRTSVEWWT